MNRNWIVGIAVAVAVSACTADRDETGAIVAEGNVDAFQMRVGDCFDDGSTFDDDNVDSVPGVPCTNPHDNEVYAVLQLCLGCIQGMAVDELVVAGKK